MSFEVCLKLRVLGKKELKVTLVKTIFITYLTLPWVNFYPVKLKGSLGTNGPIFGHLRGIFYFSRHET
jgi:hypothetical protein